MWVSKSLFNMIVADNKRQAEDVLFERTGASRMSASCMELRTQKAKDDLSIDWLRHRVNALEKQNAVLMMKATGLAMPVPEIVPNRPGSMTTIPDFDSMPSFEDVGNAEAARLGIKHSDEGIVEYTK
jgi:hypothetical protein